LTVVALVVGLSSLFSAPPLIGGIIFGLYFIPLLVAPLISEKIVGLFPVWLGDLTSRLASGDLAYDGDRWDWEPVWSCLALIPICLAFACYRLRRVQLQ
jgi:hypothetical protein